MLQGLLKNRELYVWKRTQFISQNCCHNSKFCGEWCPHFRLEYREETDKTDSQRVTSKLTRVSLCHGTVLDFDNFIIQE